MFFLRALSKQNFYNRIFMLQHHRWSDNAYINNDYVNVINSINNIIRPKKNKKKISLVSGNQPGEIFITHMPV